MSTPRIGPFANPMRGFPSADEPVFQLEAMFDSAVWVPAGQSNANADTAALLEAVRRANDAGGGVVHGNPTRQYLVNQTVPIYTAVQYRDLNLKLADGANCDVLQTDQFTSLTGTASSGGPSGFALEHVNIDGNRLNNATGWPLRIYGRAYRVKGLRILNGASGCAWSEWTGGGSEMGSVWTDFLFSDPADNTNALHWLGPHDSEFTDGQVIRTSATAGGKGIFIDRTKNGDAAEFENVHVWGKFVNCWEIGKIAFLSNCQGEGASAINLLIAATRTTVEGGMYFGTLGVASANEIGIQIGDSTTGVSHCVISTGLNNFTGAGVPLRLDNDFGYNSIVVTVKSGGQTNSWTGTLSGNSDLTILSDAGITNNHTRHHLGVPGSNVDIRGRLILTSTAVTIAAAGNFASAAAGAAGATETAASVTATANAGVPAVGGVATLTFATVWSRTPRAVIVTPTNAAAQAAGLYISAKSNAAITVSCAVAPAANAVLTFDVLVVG